MNENIIFEAPKNIRCIKFSPFSWSQNYLLITMDSVIYLVHIAYEEENAKISFTPKTIRIFQEESDINCTVWGPCNLDICFASSCVNLIITVWNWDMSQEPQNKMLAGHTDIVNAMAFSFDSNNELATVSDDHTCRIWDINKGLENFVFWLTSPGMAVAFHQNDSFKLMVGEKKGIIRFYSLNTFQAIFSLNCQLSPLLDADWCSQNKLLIASSVGSHCLIWDTSISQIFMQENLYSKACKLCRFAPNNPKCLATVGLPNYELKIMNLQSKQVISNLNMKNIVDLTWHSTLPYLAVGTKNLLIFMSIKV